MNHDEEITGGQAFPTMSQTEYIPGMTIRDWFAGQALATLLATKAGFPNGHPQQTIARAAYLMADAMIAERNIP